MGASAHCHFDGHFNLNDKEVQAFVATLAPFAWEYDAEEDRKEQREGLQYWRNFRKDEDGLVTKIPVVSYWRDKGPYRLLPNWGASDFSQEINQLIKEGKVRSVYLGGAGRDFEQWGPDEDHPYSDWFE